MAILWIDTPASDMQCVHLSCVKRVNTNPHRCCHCANEPRYTHCRNCVSYRMDRKHMHTGSHSRLGGFGLAKEDASEDTLAL